MVSIVSGEMQGTDLGGDDARIGGAERIIRGGGVEEQLQRRLVPIRSGEVNSVKSAIVPEGSVSTTLGKGYKAISSPSNGQRFPCPALISPWFSWGEAGQRPR